MVVLGWRWFSAKGLSLRLVDLSLEYCINVRYISLYIIVPKMYILNKSSKVQYHTFILGYNILYWLAEPWKWKSELHKKSSDPFNILRSHVSKPRPWFISILEKKYQVKKVKIVVHKRKMLCLMFLKRTHAETYAYLTKSIQGEWHMQPCVYGLIINQ